MGSKSDYLENKVLDHVLRNTSYTPVATVYMGLHTAAGSDSAAGAEVSGGSYARTAITFGAAASGSISNSGSVTFPTATADWNSGATIGHFVIWDAAAAGNMLYWGALTVAKTVLNGDIAKFNIGDIVVTED